MAPKFKITLKDLPSSKVPMGFIEIGEYDPSRDEYEFEGNADLYVDENGDAWAHIGNANDLPDMK
jgi:hypothetical protein